MSLSPLIGGFAVEGFAAVAEESEGNFTRRGDLGAAFSRSTLGAELGVAGADQDDLYRAMDWLLERQGRIEDRLARRHLRDGELVLYDVSSTYFEGRTC